MVMSAMRDSAKWVMLTLALAFVGWLVLDWVQARGGGGGTQANPVIGVVGDQNIRLAEWNQYLDNQMALARQQREGSLTEEESRRIRENAWDQLVNELLIQSEMQRIGIEVSDAEIQQAFRSSPPPEFLNHPAFQTDGQFDIEKYRQFFANPNIDQSILLQIESYYRNTLPRIKLERQVTAGIFVTRDEAWRWYRDRNETARVRFVSIDPAREIPDSRVEITEDEVRRYYRQNPDEFERPASATVSVVSLPSGPSTADSASARTAADSLREVIRSGEATFEEVARTASADSGSAGAGGVVGRVGRGDLVGPVDEVVFSAEPGTVSEPVPSRFGYHLVQVDERSGDSATVRHVLVPVEISRATEDSLFDRIDRLEGVALRTDLATAADSVGLPVREDVSLTRETEFVPGAGTLGVGVDWAFDSETMVGDLSPFFENAGGFHVMELHDRRPAGTYELEAVSDEIRNRLLLERKKELARERAEEAARAIEGGEPLQAVAGRHGWVVQQSRAFTRLDFVPGLGQGTPAIGEAFGLPVGETSGPVDAGDRIVILEVLERRPADRAAFEEQVDDLQRRLTLQRRQEFLSRWLAALRERAEVRDLRDQVLTSTTPTA